MRLQPRMHQASSVNLSYICPFLLMFPQYLHGESNPHPWKVVGISINPVILWNSGKMTSRSLASPSLTVKQDDNNGV